MSLSSHVPNLESFLQDLYVQQGSVATSNSVSVAVAAETSNRVSADTTINNAVSVLSQAISVLSQQVSALSNAVSTLSNAISTVGCHVVMSGKMSLANGAVTTIQLSAETFDTGNLHGANLDRISVPAAGVYYMSGELDWAANAAGERYVAILLNGGAQLVANRVINNGANVQYISISTIRRLAANDYICLVGFQNTGGGLSVDSGFLNIALVSKP